MVKRLRSLFVSKIIKGCPSGIPTGFRRKAQGCPSSAVDVSGGRWQWRVLRRVDESASYLGKTFPALHNPNVGCGWASCTRLSLSQSRNLFEVGDSSRRVFPGLRDEEQPWALGHNP